MAKAVFPALDVPNSVATGGAYDVAHLSGKALWFTDVGTGGTFDLQMSPDGTNWYDHTTGINAVGFTDIPETVKQVRIKTTALTSGTPAAVLSGVIHTVGS